MGGRKMGGMGGRGIGGREMMRDGSVVWWDGKKD